MRSDDELLEAWRRGDASAGDALVTAHFPSIHRFWIRRVGDAADDMAQQTFEACLAGSAAYRGGSFRSYLFGIAHNQLLMYLRKKRGTPEVGDAPDRLAGEQESPSQWMQVKEQHKVLTRALRSLPLDLQIAVELFYWEGLTTPEIASAVSVSQTAVRGRLWRARELLLATLQTMDIGEALRASTITHIGARLDPD